MNGLPNVQENLSNRLKSLIVEYRSLSIITREFENLFRTAVSEFKNELRATIRTF